MCKVSVAQFSDRISHRECDRDYPLCFPYRYVDQLFGALRRSNVPKYIHTNVIGNLIGLYNLLA